MSHRAPVSMNESARRLVPPLAAVSAVVIVIVLLLVLNRPTSSSGDAGPAVVPPTTSSVTPSAVPTSSAPRPTTPPPTPRHTHRAVAPPRAARPAAVPVLPLTVLNNSRRTGLAHEAAAQIQARGWPIRQVGNFTGRIAVSTVYYAPGEEAAAQALAGQFPAVQRVLPRFAGLPGHGLTLVVTREWPA